MTDWKEQEYTFMVDVRATKVEIRRAVEEVLRSRSKKVHLKMGRPEGWGRVRRQDSRVEEGCSDSGEGHTFHSLRVCKLRHVKQLE